MTRRVDAPTAHTVEERPLQVEQSNHVFLTPDEAAERLQVSAEHIRALIRSGRLQAINVAIGKKRSTLR